MLEYYQYFRKQTFKQPKVMTRLVNVETINKNISLLKNLPYYFVLKFYIRFCLVSVSFDEMIIEVILIT
jgi:hypothetical protein